MARHKAAMKDLRRSKRANLRNRMAMSTMNTAIKRVLSAKKKDLAQKALVAAVSAIDKNVGRKLLNRNNAARKKSRLYRIVNALTK